jgi:hypothetical protein
MIVAWYLTHTPYEGVAVAHLAAPTKRHRSVPQSNYRSVRYLNTASLRDRPRIRSADSYARTRQQRWVSTAMLKAVL